MRGGVRLGPSQPRGPGIRSAAQRVRQSAEAHHRRQLARWQASQGRKQERELRNFHLVVHSIARNYDRVSGVSGTIGAAGNLGQAVGGVLDVIASIRPNTKPRDDLSFVLAYHKALIELRTMITPILGPVSYQWYGAGLAGPSATFLPLAVTNIEESASQIASRSGLIARPMNLFSQGLETWRQQWERLPPQMRTPFDTWP